MKILLIDDEVELCNDLADFINSLGHQVTSVYDGNQAKIQIAQSYFDLIISDVTIPHINGIELVKIIKDLNLMSQILLISGKDDIIQSINALELGIVDFLTKPININKLAETIKIIDNKNAVSKAGKEKLIKNDFLKQRFININEFIFIEDYSYYHNDVGKIGIFSEKMASIYKKLKKIQEFPDIPVLIEGETGTGKEIIAKYIHFENINLVGPFIGINCSTLPRELFDAELFGYEKGAFTGADSKGRDGKLKLAENGTLFLDEITEIPLDLQVKLLRVIQEREYYKIGGNRKYAVNTRISCATNRNIKELVENRIFREDLYFRLNICQVTIPPLRERKEEIIPLTVFFLKELNQQLHKNIKEIDTDVLSLLENYDWPGNVRELKNLLNKVMLFSDSNRLGINDFRNYLNIKTARSRKIKLETKLDINQFELPDNPFNLNDLIDIIVKKSLKKFNGNKTKTAEYLGLSRIQLYRRFKY